jgi:medium-chain acyl-[acyl-carrier-protein] hydrolase
MTMDNKLNGNGRGETTNPWFSRQTLGSDATLRLFVLPPAGGGSFIYHGWDEATPANVKVCPVHLPGRGGRLHEPAFTRLAPLVRSLGQAMSPYFNKRFALFGHSMGALVIFELSRYLRNEYGVEPQALFVSGGRAPDVPEGRKDYLLPDGEFVEMLRELNGTPAEILDNQEALQLLLPVIRADFEVIQTYEYSEGRPLSSPIVAFGGTSDAGTPQEVIRPWSRHTTGSFSLTMLPGGHFFIDESRSELLRLLSRELQRITGAAAS